MDKPTIDTYNKLAHEYDEETMGFWDMFPDTITTHFANSVSGQKNVLNVGSGPGRDGLLLQRKGVEVHCLDASYKWLWVIFYHCPLVPKRLMVCGRILHYYTCEKMSYRQHYWKYGGYSKHRVCWALV